MAGMQNARYDIGTAVAIAIHTNTAEPCMNRYVITTLNAGETEAGK